MNIHVIQKHITNTNLAPFIEAAEAEGADLVCFSELATTGCLYEPRTVDSIEMVLDMLSQFKIRVMTGLPFITELGAYNSYMYYHRGKHQLYHKINLFPPFNEPQLFQAGTSPGVFDTDLGRFGAAICYDIRFGEIFQELTRQNVERIFIPAAFPRVRVDQWRDMLVARARETHRPVIGINAVGSDGTTEFGGISMALDGNGEIIAEADQTSETVLKVTV